MTQESRETAVQALIAEWNDRAFKACDDLTGMPGAWKNGLCPRCHCTPWAHAWREAVDELAALLLREGPPQEPQSIRPSICDPEHYPEDMAYAGENYAESAHIRTADQKRAPSAKGGSGPDARGGASAGDPERRDGARVGDRRCDRDGDQEVRGETVEVTTGLREGQEHDTGRIHTAENHLRERESLHRNGAAGDQVKYTTVRDGEWIVPTPQCGHKMACCDCGLVHRMDFRVSRGQVQFRAFRDARATAGRRRGHSLTEVIAGTLRDPEHEPSKLDDEGSNPSARTTTPLTSSHAGEASREAVPDHCENCRAEMPVTTVHLCHACLPSAPRDHAGEAPATEPEAMNATGPAATGIDTPLKQAVRQAFDHPTIANIEAVALAASQAGTTPREIK